MCAVAPRSARLQLFMHMSKMAIVIDVNILSMLHAYVENGRRNWHAYSVHRGFGGSFWRAVLHYKKENTYKTTKPGSFCVCQNLSILEYWKLKVTFIIFSQVRAMSDRLSWPHTCPMDWALRVSGRPGNWWNLSYSPFHVTFGVILKSPYDTHVC